MKFSFIIFILLVVNIGSTQNVSLKDRINEQLSTETFDYASVGISVRTLKGKEVVSISSDKKLIPASSLKLITNFSALKALGPDYKFKTRVGYSGKIDRSGTLIGDIVIIGSGDPSFASERFGVENSWERILSTIISSIQKAGIRCIDGSIEVKTNVFEGQAICPSWPYSDVANYYGGGAWGLNFNENEYNLYFTGNRPEASIATLERIYPEIPNMNLKSEVIIKGAETGDNAYIYGDPFNYSKIVRGSIPFSNSEFKIKGAIPNPPLSFGYLLQSELAKQKIETSGATGSKIPMRRSDFQELCSFQSPELSEIIKQANYESINLYCESLLRILGRKFKDQGSISGGTEYLEDELVSMGIDKYSFSINDGSGLSPRNGIAPSSFTQFLVGIAETLKLKDIIKYIPQVGVSGTVSGMMNQKKGQNNFYLKSGSMGGVLSYSGYFKGQSGEWYSICFISNNHSRGNYKVKLAAEQIFEGLYLNL